MSIGFFSVVLLMGVGCNQEFAESPQGSLIVCSDSVDTTAVAASLDVTAEVLGPNGIPINGAAVFVEIVGSSTTTLEDFFNHAPLPSEFFTQTNDQGNIQLTIVGDSCGCGEPIGYGVQFDIGVSSCFTALNITCPAELCET
jgi:hypothetical protein